MKNTTSIFKRTLLSVFVFLSVLAFSIPANATRTVYTFLELTGGGADALDFIDGADLADGDFAIGLDSARGLVYLLDDDSAAGESSPDIIAMDTNGGDKRWILQKAYVDSDLLDGTRYAADAEASDTYVITLSPTPTAYYDGMVIVFMANTANTGACTVNVNGLGAKSIKKLHDTDPATGDIESGQIVTAIYDGTNFQMQSQIAAATPGLAADTLWAAAGDLVKGTGNDTADILSIGSANDKLFVNAAGTTVEYDHGLYAGSNTYDLTTASGTQAITGVGFKPSAILIQGAIISVADLFSTSYHQNGSTDGGIGQRVEAAGVRMSVHAGVEIQTAAGSYQYGTVTAYGADGFTISWTKAGTPTGTLTYKYICFR
ncbi:MAG: hypothetical protein JRD05_00785 [Deltaproteobacteria bacterium]|nr:hypothetical protein [Deltaproteobacteria bacterium]